MNAEMLAETLREATDGLDVRPGFATAVVSGARRRRTRRRVISAVTAMAAVVAIGVAGVSYFGNPAHTGVQTAADARLTRPTGGDLAGDGTFVRLAVEAWQAGIKRSPNASRGLFDDLRGAPHVYWAGTTPAGATAVVLQQAYLDDHDNLSVNDDSRLQTLVGLIAKDPRDGVVKLVEDQYRATNFPSPGYFRFGPGDRTVLVLERDEPVFYSGAARTAEKGAAVRDWQPMVFTSGVAFAEVPVGGDPRLVAGAVKPAPDSKNVDGLLNLTPASDYLRVVDDPAGNSAGLVDVRLPWSGYAALVGEDPRDPGRVALQEDLENSGALDMGANSQAFGTWRVVAGLPGGRTAMVGEHQADDRSRLYTVLLDAAGKVERVVPGPFVDRTAVLPVAVHLEGGLGWIVACRGATLSYQDGSGWHDTGRDAALLPESATDVRVVQPGGTAAVPLSR